MTTGSTSTPLRRAGLVLPFAPYPRQDKSCPTGGSFSENPARTFPVRIDRSADFDPGMTGRSTQPGREAVTGMSIPGFFEGREGSNG